MSTWFQTHQQPVSFALDEQIQEHFNHFHTDPIAELQRWFTQPINHIALETLDFKKQWLEIVDSALNYYQ
jgi:hypothetical protein